MDGRQRSLQKVHRSLTRLLEALAAQEVTVTVGPGGLMFRGDGVESGQALLLIKDIESLYEAHPVWVRTMVKARPGA